MPVDDKDGRLRKMDTYFRVFPRETTTPNATTPDDAGNLIF